MTTHPVEFTPACAVSDPYLFESTLMIDHLKAREICKTCPAKVVAACRRLAEAPEQNYHDGTWAGVLYVDGRPSKKGKRFYRTREVFA